MEITTTEDLLVKNLVKYFTTDLSNNLDKSDLDKEEKDANMVLSRKKIITEAESIAYVVFKSFE
jgi:hypothetical protein